MGLCRAADFVATLAALTEADLQTHVSCAKVPKLPRSALRTRYVLLALMINLPDNVVLGGAQVSR